MFKIGEFSKLTQVSVRMLRHYDEIDLLKPAQTDKFTGYRLYSMEQIPYLQKIVLLRDMNFTTAEIAEALKVWNTDSVVALLENKKQQIADLIRAEQQRLQKITMAIKDPTGKQNFHPLQCND